MSGAGNFYMGAVMAGFALVAVRVWWGDRKRYYRQQFVRNRLAGYLIPEAADGAPSERYFDSRIRPSIYRWRDSLAKRLTPANFRDEIAQKLRMAGSRQSPERFFFSRLVFAASMLGTGLLFTWVMGLMDFENQDVTLLVPLAAAMVGFLLPGIRLNTQAEKRRAAVEQSLPEVFDLLSVSVEAGLAFDGALRRVVENTDGPVHDEFAKVLADMQVGLPRVEALQALSARVRSDHLRRFASQVAQAERTGAGMASTLKIQARDIKYWRSSRAREKAASLPIKIIFPMVIFIFPAVFVVILGPAIVSVVHLIGHG